MTEITDLFLDTLRPCRAAPRTLLSSTGGGAAGGYACLTKRPGRGWNCLSHIGSDHFGMAELTFSSSLEALDRSRLGLQRECRLDAL